MTYILIALVFVIITILIIIGIKYLFDKKEKDPYNDICYLAIKNEYMLKEEIVFYQFMSTHLPSDWVICPKVGLGNLLVPLIQKGQHDKLLNEYVDFVLFQKDTMKPILVIDLLADVHSNRTIEKFSRPVIEALKMVNIPILPVKVQEYYIMDELEARINEALEKAKLIEFNNSESK